jgi:uncharacterized membrane protein
MSSVVITAVLAVIREAGALLLVGSMFLVLAVLMPAVERVRSPRQRMALRRGIYGRMFAWAWIGLLLLWSTGIAELALDQAPLPGHVVLMAALSLLFLLVFLIAQFGLHFRALMVLDDGNSEHARYLLHRLRPILILALIIAVVVTVLDVSGPVLVPSDFVDRLRGTELEPPG